MSVAERAIGAPISRIEGREKVAGEAKYAYEHPVEGALYAVLVRATVAKGRIRTLHETDARSVPGVVALLTHENAPKLQTEDGELRILQSPDVAYRGQVVGTAIAETLEAAQEAQRLLRIEYDEADHDVELRWDHPGLYTPPKVNPSFETDTSDGDPDGAFDGAEVKLDETYTTPAEHNNAMEPHATLAVWEGDGLTLYDSNQGAYIVRQTVAEAFGLQPERVHVISPHVGGGFGSKGTPRPHVIAAVMASKLTQRPVKLAVTRQQMFDVTGYRTPTIQRVRLGAGRDGRLVSIAHDVAEQTSTLKEFAEQTAVVTRMLYASPNRRTTHKVVKLDVPTPSWMRAPGECPGMFALESAMDELAIALDLDPIELRIRNEPKVDPETGYPFSTRNLVACLREGAERFGWAGRAPRRDGRRLIGTGVAASTYPARRAPTTAHARRESDGTYTIRVTAADIGTGARTVLTQIAADELDVPLGRVRVEIGDSDFGQAMLAGGSMGTSSWGFAVVKACRTLLAGDDDEVSVDTNEEAQAKDRVSRHAFGAQFVEVSVDIDTAEIRVPRVLGVFGVGRIINPKTARSQLIGGMTMGIGMALLEESIVDTEFGDFANHDLAQYHVPVNADIQEIEAAWIDEEDFAVNPMGAKGIGEIGIVGTAAAVANAVHHATGVRVRNLPIRPDRLLGKL